MGKLFKKLQSKRKKGFTLIEVLVVVIILGALAAAAVPTYHKIIRKSRVSDGLHVLEMLANAQDKYFIENGFYAQNITQLKAPFKELRRVDPANPFRTIETTNFTYTKEFSKNCIEARAKVGGSYRLIKNYKTKEQIVCMGSFCGNLTDYVSEINNEQYATLCPDEDQCTLNQQQCSNLHPGTHFFPDTCLCDCSHNAYVECLQEGGTFIQDGCFCDKTGPCDPTQNYSGYGADCPYTGPIPVYGKGNTNIIEQINKESEGGETKGSNPSTPPGGGIVKPTCGILFNTHICDEATGRWTDTTECIYKAIYCSTLGPGYVLNTQTCECIKECPKPQPSVGEFCGAYEHNIETCDPCSSQSQVVPGQPNTRGGKKGGIGEPIQEHCCGYRTYSREVECNYQTGEWQCVNNNPCTKVDSDEIGKPCDGTGTAGSQCGVKKYSGCKLNDSFSGVDVLTTCELNTEAGNECFDGATRGCTVPGTGEAGIEHCVGCHWDNNCMPIGCSGAQPTSVVGECGVTKYDCQLVNGNWEWVGGFEFFEGNECETGEISTDDCPAGQFKVCTDCHWSDCITMGCDENNKLTPGQVDVNGNTNIKDCHIKDGVEDPDLYCGTMTTNKQICDDNDNWVWDFTNVECSNVHEKPQDDPVQYPGNVCLVHEIIRGCTLSGNEYWWNAVDWTEPHLRAGANCSTIGQILGGGESFPIFCSEFCKAAKCKLPYFYNHKMKACYTHESKVAVINTVTPATPPNGNATGTVKNFYICGPINQNTNYDGQQCLRTCVTNDELTTRTTNFDDGEDYCYNTETALIAVSVSQTPVTVNVCGNSLPNNRKWNKREEFTAYKCIKGGANNYQFVPYP